jgi:hypothetical protein
MSSKKEVTLAAKVGLLSRCIEIVGAEYAAMQSEAFGARVLVASAYTTSTGATIGNIIKWTFSRAISLF